jgi:hypothetical protein
LRKGMYSMGSYGTFRRGFLAEWKGPLDAWLEHGKALAAAHPLERVELSGKEPRNFPRHLTWAWYHGGSSEANLPEDVFALLDGFLEPLSSSLAKYYPSREKALAAASRALLAWARQPVPARA